LVSEDFPQVSQELLQGFFVLSLFRAVRVGKADFEKITLVSGEI
jgi:hypothetical protein